MKLVCVPTVEVLTFDTSASAVFGRRLDVTGAPIASLDTDVSIASLRITTVSLDVPTVSPAEVSALPQKSLEEKARDIDDDGGILMLTPLLPLSTSDGVTSADLNTTQNHANLYGLGLDTALPE